MTDYFLFPAPRQIQLSKETFRFDNRSLIVADPNVSQPFKQHVHRFAGHCSKTFSRSFCVTAGVSDQSLVFLRIDVQSKKICAQGYTLTAANTGMLLEASDEAGAYYGLQTLAQIIDQAGSSIHGLTIRDWPDFPNRGFMLDISRCKVPSMKTLFKYADMLAMFKMNQFQLYMEHTFAFTKHETVWFDSSPITPEEILTLDAYCKERYIELVPNFNSFGHFERWLRHPEYVHLAECPDGFVYPWDGRKSPWGSVLKPDLACIQFIDTLYKELLPNFTSNQFNVGCDETWELGSGWSKPLCEKKGKQQVYLDHLLRIHKLVKRYGRTMMFWGDIILHEPTLIKRLPRDGIALNWGYEASHPFDKEGAIFERSGIPYYVCPGTSSWCSITGRTANAIDNCNNAAFQGLRHGACGYLITDWGDGGHHQYLPISYVGMLAGAAASWCFSTNKNSDIAGAINRFIVHDTTGIAGQVLLDIGRVLELSPDRLSNNSIFNALLFWDDPFKKMPKTKAAHLKACLKRLEELGSKLADAHPRSSDGALVKEEITNAIAMARFAANKGLLILHDRSSDKPTDANHVLQHIIGKHEELWLKRNRCGGLNESSGILRKQLLL